LDHLPEALQPRARELARNETVVLERFREILDTKISALRTRCHGDFHLGQVLFTGNDFVIIDFEGEPSRPVSQRRIKTSPLRDVAGMIRSFHYASHAALRGQAPGGVVTGRPQQDLAQWLRAWYAWVSAAYLRGYLGDPNVAALLPQDPQTLRTLLDAHIMEKAFYELVYELNNRPDWVAIPIEGIQEFIPIGAERTS
jgi:maltose alpha-D-glucosyltransferase/alpha-amylase